LKLGGTFFTGSWAGFTAADAAEAPDSPLDASTRPLLRLFGTPERDKELTVYETGHAVWRTNELYRDGVAFLDEHLGPAR
jgi:hypothetical protein